MSDPAPIPARAPSPSSPAHADVTDVVLSALAEVRSQEARVSALPAQRTPPLPTLLPGGFLERLAGLVGPPHVLTGEEALGYSCDWTGRFRGVAAAVVRPGSTGEVAAVLRACSAAGVPVVPQGGNTGLVGGGVPLRGELVLSLRRLDGIGPVDLVSRQVTADAGATLARVSAAHPDLDLGVLIASGGSATVGGAVATNAGGLRVLRYGPMRSQVRGVEAVLSDGTVVSHLGGLHKDNTGYDYPSLLAGSEGTLAVVTKVRLQLVPRLGTSVTALVSLPDLAALHALALRAVNHLSHPVSAEFFTSVGLDLLTRHAGIAPPFADPAGAYLLLEAAGPDALDELAELVGERPVAVALDASERSRLWAYRERHPEAAGFVGAPLKFDVSVPAARWVELAQGVAARVRAVDPSALVVTFDHVADGNVHVNVVPAASADGRHQDAVFSYVAELGGSISAEHGVGALKAPWLHLVRSEGELELFRRIRRSLDPTGTLNPNVLPR